MATGILGTGAGGVLLDKMGADVGTALWMSAGVNLAAATVLIAAFLLSQVRMLPLEISLTTSQQPRLFLCLRALVSRHR